MKRFTVLALVACAVVLAVCNARKLTTGTQQPSATLPLKPPAAEGKKQAGPSGARPKVAAVSTPARSYREELEEAFAEDSTVAEAFKRFRAELPRAREKGETAVLFDEFDDCRAFSSGRNVVAEHRPVVRAWVKLARAEKDEAVRMLFANHINSFQVEDRRRRYFYVENNQIRPGEELRVHGYHYYYDEGRRRPQKVTVEMALLKLDEKLRPAGFVPVMSDTATFRNYEDVYKRRVKDPGVYRVVVSTDEQFLQLYIQVSWLDCVVKADARTVLVFGSSFKDTLAPPYTVHFVDERGEVYTDRTDQQGTLYLKHLFGTTTSSAALKVILEKDGQLAFMNNSIPYVHHDTTMEYYLYTDRPVYRPGNRVHVRGMLKLVVDAQRIAPAEVDSVELSIADPQGSQVWRDTLAVDQWGHFGDSIDIEESGKQGRYQIQYHGVRNRPDSKNPSHSPRGYHQASFLVDSYKKPEFLITVKPDKETYLAGEEVVVKVKGEYYFGGALAGVPVTVRWHRQTMGHYFSTWGEERCVFYPTGTRQFVRQEELKLNKTGELTLTWKAGAESATPYGYVIAEVIATDQSRREVREEAKVQVVRHDAYLAILPDKYEYEVSETARIEIVAVDMAGNALSGNVSLRVKKDKGVLSEEQLAIPGTGRVHAELAVTEAGTYTFEASAKDRQGKVAYVECSVHAVKKRTWDWNWERIEISADKKQYSVGDTAHISVKTGADKTRALCTVEGQRLNEWRVRVLEDHALAYDLPITAGLGANVQLHVAFSAAAQMAYSSHAFTVIDSAMLLRVKLTGARTLKPGDTFTGTIAVTDRAGRPTRACVSVALVDEAIFDVAKALEKANVYGYDYDYYWYYNQDRPKGVLGIMPPWYGNWVSTAYNRFDPRFLGALEGVAQALAQPASPPMEAESRDMAKSAPARSMAGGGARMKKEAAQSTADEVASGAEMDKADDAEAGGEPPRERKEFRDLGYWNPSLAVGANGTGRVSFVVPDDLTKWRLVLVGSDGATRLVEFRDSLITRQDIMAKLEAPRGFVVDDSALVATVVHNYSEKPVNAKVSLEIRRGAECVVLRGKNVQTVAVEPNGTERVDWPVVARAGGTVSFATTVVTTAGSDAETRTYPVRVRGIPKAISDAGVLTENDAEVTAKLPSPEQAAIGSRTLTIEYAPTLAYSMFESLEYLTGYPYGCVEQTMSRFLPNLYVAGVLTRLGIRNDSLTKMIPEYTHKGLERLKKFQHGDGGWGWWEQDNTDPRMTALVVYGLAYALHSDIDPKDKAVAQAMLTEGVRSAVSQMKSRKEHQTMLLAHAVCAAGAADEAESTVMSLYGKRGNLSAYEMAMLLECLVTLEKRAEATRMVDLLASKATVSGGGAFWGSGSAYAWYRQDEETTARALRALVSASPNHELVPKVVSWLGRVKRDGYWVCTKTTAVVIDALSFYLAQSGEFDPDYRARVELNGTVLVSVQVTKASLRNWKGRIVLPDSLIGGRNDLRFSMKGTGRLYWSVHLRYATNEQPIAAADNGIVVKRTYTRLVYRQRQDGEWEVVREPFEGELKGGDELEVSIEVRNTRPYEYLLLEDYFPSGMEVLHKAEDWYSRWCRYWWYGYTHKEARDDRMVWFVNYLGNGERTFSYLLRAETPGVFVGLPARAEMMYEPEVCGNSAEELVRILDAPGH